MNVLVWGGGSPGPCDYFRGTMFTSVLADLGVELRSDNIKTCTEIFDKAGHSITEIESDRLQRGLQDGTYRTHITVETESLNWADIILFRRDYNTTFACSLDVGLCTFRSEDINEAINHPHLLNQRKDTVTLSTWKALSMLSTGDRPAIVYDTDDYLIGERKMTWNGLWADYYAHRHLCRDMAKKADLVTVTTPTLASMYRYANRNIRVIRNAINPDLYRTDAPRPERSKPVMLYYGSAVRMRDFGGYPDDNGKVRGGYAFKAVLDLKRELNTMFLGAEPGSEKIVREFGFDDIRGPVEGVEAFAPVLAATHADIGIAPLWGDEFDAAKSELHYLEYSAIGAATVAERMDGRGPYSVIRDGVDGFLVRGRQQWYDSLRRLAREPNLRTDIAAAAKERVLREYDFRVRAPEWVAAFEWALEHKGIGEKVA